MIIIRENKIINFDNVREVFQSDSYNGIGGNFIYFWFDQQDTTTWGFDSEKELLEAWNKIIEACKNQWPMCEL